MDLPEKPEVCNLYRGYHTNGFGPIGKRHLGLPVVISDIREPLPAAKTTAWNSTCKAICDIVDVIKSFMYFNCLVDEPKYVIISFPYFVNKQNVNYS